jgi:hypothetical protein
MRKIIDGKIYDTNTAQKLCDIGNDEGQSQFTYDWTYLYRSPKGAFFIAGEGGPRSRWGERTSHGIGGGEGLKLVTEAEARELFELHGDPDLYEQVFGALEQG